MKVIAACLFMACVLILGTLMNVELIGSERWPTAEASVVQTWTSPRRRSCAVVVEYTYTVAGVQYKSADWGESGIRCDSRDEAERDWALWWRVPVWIAAVAVVAGGIAWVAWLGKRRQ